MSKVSVITTAFNASRTLGRAIASLSRQTDGNWEHIIVNDGSHDDGGYYAANYAKKERRAFVLHTPNRGIGAALNFGITHVTGEYVAFLDSDDEFKPDHLSKHLASIKANASVDLFWGGLEVIADTEDQKYFPDMDKGKGKIHAEECCVTGTFFGKRELFKRLRFSSDREVWCPDYEFLSRAKEQYNTARFFEKTYRYYRNSPSSTFTQYHRMLGSEGMWNVKQKLEKA